MTTGREGQLGVTNHDRDVVAKRYVYPVVSRRAGGVSVGINLNPNNACNWACQYCQVPDLVRGKGPSIDLDRLAQELGEMLAELVEGDFMARRVPAGSRELKDIALSGNGEPTTSPQLGEALQVIGAALERFELRGKLPVVLITNGSMLGKPRIQAAVRHLSELGGQVWCKLDGATDAALARINGTPVAVDQHLARLRRAASLCDTWIQTCMFARDGQPPAADELNAYLACLTDLARGEHAPSGVLLYTLARPPLQPGAERLSALSQPWLAELGERIEAAGLPVKVVS
ncbi:MAG: radical SAM protein [Deltaproteobacteria bacterium]|nr:radical SAM protein [Deltaproteobacteria bacterium]